MFYRRDLRVEAAPDAFVAIRCFRSASSKDIICYHVLVTEFENNENVPRMAYVASDFSFHS